LATASAHSLLAVVSSGIGVGFGVGLVLAGAAQLAFKPRAKPARSEHALGPRSRRPLQARSTPEPTPPATGATAEQAPSLEPPGANESNRGSNQPGAAAASSKRGAPEIAPSNGSGAVPGSPLRAELDLMARVQEALRDARGARALELIAQYDAHHPSGMLRDGSAWRPKYSRLANRGLCARAARGHSRFWRETAPRRFSARVKHAARPMMLERDFATPLCSRRPLTAKGVKVTMIKSTLLSRRAGFGVRPVFHRRQGLPRGDVSLGNDGTAAGNGQRHHRRWSAMATTGAGPGAIRQREPMPTPTNLVPCTGLSLATTSTRNRARACPLLEQREFTSLESCQASCEPGSGGAGRGLAPQEPRSPWIPRV